MIHDLIVEKSFGVSRINWNLEVDDYDPFPYFAYIDHQSSAKGGRNIEMFESVNKLRKFIFARDSLIQTDNDNR